MVALLAWVLCPLIGYMIGEKKGREVAGFLWGLFLGPIGWLLVAIGPDMRPACPKCKGAIPEGATKCQHCGSDLEVAQEKAYQPPATFQK